MATRIMVVEDDPLISRLITFQLGGAGYEVLSAPNGFEALARFEQEMPDLLLLDVMMPGMSGWEVCQQVRASSAVPIIMLTAKGADDDIVAGLTAGADDYVTKPFTLVQLQARIEAVLRRSRPASPTPRPPDQRPQPVVRHTPAPAAAQHGSTPQRLGQQLQSARMAAGASLHDAALACDVRWEFLQALEREHFGFMPPAELRHSLRAYARYLGLDLYTLTGRTRPRPTAPSPLPLFALAAALILALVLGIALLGPL